MQAIPAIGNAARSPDGCSSSAVESTTVWVDVSRRAASHGLAGQVCITHAAWMYAVYFVRDPDDRLDPVRENWRMGRLIEEVSCAMSARIRPGPDPSEFTLSLEEGFDRLRSLELPAAQLHVRVEHDHASLEIWVDVARSDGRHRARPAEH
jgi:hypothetical protein